jgi:hypothetical protein
MCPTFSSMALQAMDVVAPVAAVVHHDQDKLHFKLLKKKIKAVVD